MAKANKDGWIRHRGGKCPVARDTLIDVRHRDGEIHIGVRALKDRNALYTQWIHDTPHKASVEIMAYRLHTPATKPEPKPMTAEEIRTQYMENLASIALLHTKNAALVDELRKLGFDLYTAEKEPQEYMSDPKNWRVGDKIEVISEDVASILPHGSIQEITRIEGEMIYFTDTCGGCKESMDGILKYFKFHSRPSK